MSRFHGTCLRLVLATDPAAISDLIEIAKQERIVDFSGTRLVPPGIIGKLDMGDPIEVPLDRGR
jgi:hypothetical protein